METGPRMSERMKADAYRSPKAEEEEILEVDRSAGSDPLPHAGRCLALTAAEPAVTVYETSERPRLVETIITEEMKVLESRVREAKYLVALDDEE